MRVIEGALRCAVVGALGAGLVAFLDCGRGALGFASVVPAGKWLVVWSWYAAAGAGLGLVVGSVAGALSVPRRLLPAVTLGFVAAGAVWLAVMQKAGGARGGWVPVLTALGALLFAAGAAWALARAGLGRMPFRTFPAALLVSLVVAVGVDAFVRPEESEPPVVREKTGEHPSVLFVVVDTLRADHMSLYGYERPTTPHLDRLLVNGLVYDRAYAPSPWTKPSVPTFLTGLAPGVHGVESWPDVLTGRAVTVAEQFRTAGYRTGLFSDNIFLSARFNHDQGFEEVVDRGGGPAAERLRLPRRTLLGGALHEIVGRESPASSDFFRPRFTAREINDRFLAWLEGVDGAEPWFAYLHYVEPHAPYEPPQPWEYRFPRSADGGGQFWTDCGWAPFEKGAEIPEEQRLALLDAYDDCIAYWDESFHGLLGELERSGRLENTIILFTADHGESFYDHGTWLHMRSLHEELIRAPLAILGPGVRPGRVPYTVSLSGIPETLLALAGFESADPYSALRGPSFHPAPAGDRECHARLVYRGEMHQSVVKGAEKWILARRKGEVVLQHFDLDRDPAEADDLEVSRTELGEEMHRKLRRIAEVESRVGLDSGRLEDTRGLADDMRGLGYLK